jgi:branched-chain amino acid aminotransferase
MDRRPNVMIMVSSLSLYPAEAYELGLKVITSSFRVAPPDVLDPRLKCIGRYAANILAKQEANARGAGEALMLNSIGQLAECTGDNIFLVKGRTLLTPHPASGILLGVTRNAAIELARDAGHPVEETFLTPFDVFTADEAFLTGTAAELIPMISLDGKAIGCGTPGPVTIALMARFRAHTAVGTAF